MDYNMNDDFNNQESQEEFSYNYDEYNDNNEEVVLNKKNKKGILKPILIILLVIILIGGLAFLALKLLNNKNNEGITLIVSDTLDLLVGDSKKIDVRVNGINEQDLELGFISENESVATVTSDGMVTGISDGSTTIIVTYYDEENNLYSKNCLVSVAKKSGNDGGDNPNSNVVPNNDKQGPVIKYTVPTSSNGWYKGNVVISLSVSDSSGIKSIKYAINCSSNCSYTDVTNSNKIAISGNGTKNIKIVAVDKKGNESQESLSVKLDNTKPTAKLSISNNTVYNNSGSVEVCATCTDTGSGCKEAKVCQTHTQSIEKVSLIIYDKAGNSTTTDSYKVVIDKTKPTCSLTYSNTDKKITATVSDTGGSGLLYYGLNEKYTGSNTKETSDVKAGTYKYYVKDNAGNTNTCSLTCGFTSWVTSGYKTPGTCYPYSKTAAERDGATWARECNQDGTVKQEWSRSFKCE